MVRSVLVSLSFAVVFSATCWAAHPHHKHAAAAAPASSAAPSASTAAVSAPLVAGMAIPGPPQVDARSYILVDYQTGKVLAANSATERMEPASLTKLMTAYIVFHELSVGKLKLEDMVTVSEHAWRSEGSRTFIELGKPVSVNDLILGKIGRAHV